MTGGSFLDSNVLVYTDDASRPSKRDWAIALVGRLMRERSGVVSLQVLQEYFSAATRKLGVDPGTARAKVELMGAFSAPPVELDDVLAAIDLHRLHTLSFWDALVVRAAQQARCVRLYSEDLQHGRRFGGVEVVNPFAEMASPAKRRRTR